MYDTTNYPIGAIIVRFQEDDLHEGHHYLIKQVTDNHQKVVVFLGVSPIMGTQRNPLDFNNRRLMIHNHYPNVVVVSLPDQGDNTRWAQTLDRRLREVFPYGNVLLYGSRASFIPFYKDGEGQFDCQELIEIPSESGSDIRKRISETIINSTDFRAGIIYHTYNQPPKTFPAVYTAIFNDKGQILLSMKKWEEKFRFIGAFATVDDESYENTIKRKFYQDAGGVEIGGFEYIGSCQIPDWRLRGCPDKMIGTFLKSKLLFGKLEPSRDIEELKWFKPSDIFDGTGRSIVINSQIVEDHHVLVKLLSKSLNPDPAPTLSW